MKEYEAYKKAQDKAEQTNDTWFVVTSREQEGYDYDIASSASLNKQTVVCGMVRPDGQKDSTNTPQQANS